MVTSSKNPSAVQASDLPVRIVQIFNRQLVLPKDTLCEAFLSYHLKATYQGRFGAKPEMEATFQVVAVIKLFHSHLPDRKKEIHFTVYEETSKKYPWIKARTFYLESGGHFFREVARDAILRNVQWTEAVEAMNQMFMAGNINLKGLKACLPKKKCLG